MGQQIKEEKRAALIGGGPHICDGGGCKTKKDVKCVICPEKLLEKKKHRYL